MNHPRRTTQLRAKFLRGSTLRLVWVITDLGTTFADLVADARRDVPDLLVSEQVEARRDGTTWRVVDDGVGTWLIANVLVRPWLDPVRDRDRRATTPTD